MDVRGTNSSDILTGTGGSDRILGLLGDDRLDGLAGDDRLDGGAGLDHLTGGDGTDYLEGGAGADRLEGGEGRDFAVYLASTAVVVDLTAAAQTGGEAEGDILSGIENVVGSAFADTLIGDASDNTLRGAAGADTIDGGDGLSDRASYAMSAASVDVDLRRTGAQIGGDATGDVIVRIEDLTGSDYADRLVGDDGDNALNGSGGGDLIDGGAGRDTAEYGGSTAVDVDLSRYGQQSGGDAEGDVLVGIENLDGSAFGDRLAGDAGANHLTGRGGDDVLVGNGGRDALYGGAGDDTLVAGVGSIADGGVGNDTLVVDLSGLSEPSAFGFDVQQQADGLLDVDDRRSPLFVASKGIHTVGFERIEIIGSDGADRLWSTAGADVLRGGAGADSIFGGGGDLLDGGDGRDTAFLNYVSTTDDIVVDERSGTATGYAAVVNFEAAYVITDAGDDVVYGGDADNVISTRAGDDLVVLGSGDNAVDVGWGDDTVVGGSGDDHVTVREAGEFDGGGGENRLSLTFDAEAAATVDVAGGADFAGLTSTGASFRNFASIDIRGSDGDDAFALGAEVDVVLGRGGGDRIFGGGGDDGLYGHNGDDEIDGGAGDDEVDGGIGFNVLSGGSGADRFVFGSGNDTIADFDPAEGDVLVIPLAFSRYGGMPGTFDDLVARAVETDDGLSIRSDNDASGVLLAGIDLDDLTAASFDFVG